MAKTKKKLAKPAKKVAKAKPTAKAKKVAKAKPVAKKAVKKAPAKAAPKKVVAKKVAAPKKVKATKKEEVKPVIKKAAEPAPKKEHKPIAPPVKLSPSQLNIFPIINQRPIAHKPAKAAVVSDDKTRYSDEELKEFETLILGKLDKAREEFRILKETLNRNNDSGTDATSGGNTKVLEDGAETAEKENLSQLAARQLKYITNLENALIRIKNRTYGICSVTGKLIPKERLIAVPHTTQSIEAKMMKQD
ncbi:MAG: TraR/DksA C4-type zinc finger protein [Cyclobacteriaceae bacterium]|nr:TraR/DksA C4-type zinc finger protein [Cyclobacteriaceae bacterium]